MSVTLQNKKKLGVGIAAVAAAAITLGAGTYAFFSSTAAPTDTTATAAKLQLGQKVSGDLILSGLVPSNTVVKSNKLELTNSGDVTANLSIATEIVDTEDGCDGDEASVPDNCSDTNGPGDLSGKLQVVVKSNGNPLYSGPVSGLLSKDLKTSNVAPGDTVTYTFEYTFPEGGNDDNAAQGDKTKITTTATLKS